MASIDTLRGGSADEGANPACYSLARLTLTDFRCYRAQRLEIDARPVVLSGPNGAGKTNILEAISLLVPGRGLRGARLDALARRDAAARDEDSGRAWAVAASVRTPRGPVELGTGREPEATGGGRERRTVRIDGGPAKNQAVLAEHLSAVWLTPQMDRLFVDGTAARRRFLDRLVFGFDPAHAGRVTAYEHALRERARLLRGGAPGRKPDSAWLTALEETMAAKGAAVAAARREVVLRLAEYCVVGAGVFPAAHVALGGAVESWLDDRPALAAEETFRESLAASRSRDAETGGAAFGPHRTDLVVRMAANGVVAEECSTGEQKALLIAIVLAHARMQAAERASVPVLLLDEVAAHLDAARRQALFDEILALGAQAWLAGTEAELFRPLAGRAQFFTVAEAVATPAD